MCWILLSLPASATTKMLMPFKLSLEKTQAHKLQSLQAGGEIMRRLRIILTALFVIVISASATLAQRPISVQPGRYEIQITLTGKVLDLKQEDMRSVQQYYRGNVVNQQWDIESAGSNYYYIRSAQNSAYLGIEGTPREGARVAATSGNRQDMWRFLELGNGNVMIVHRSGMVLDLTDGSNRDGTIMQVWSQAANTHQQFRLLPVNLAAAGYNQRSTGRTEYSSGAVYNEAYRAGVNDRESNLRQNYRRHRSMYDINTERDFEQAYNAGYNNERRSDDTSGRRYDDDLSGMSQSERRIYDDAYQLGQRDARASNSANYRRYSDRYNRWQESSFQRGYQAGYNSANRGGYNTDQFDLNSLTTYERRAYDEGYRLGQQDVRSGYSLNYRRYSNRITDNRLERFFQRGYEVGYNSTRR
jgi:hypothetical protein